MQRPSSQNSAKTSAAQDKKAPEKFARIAADDALEESLKVDSSAGLDVPVAARQRSQTKSYKVRCPMCDTVGYVPRSSAGKEIRCANRDCMVPVFTAPRPEKKQEEEVAPPKRLTPKNLMMGFTAVAACAIAVLFFIRNQPVEPTKGKEPILPPPTLNPQGAADPKDKPKEPKPAVEKPLTVHEERDAVLAMMAKAAEDKSHNRSRPLCERLTAHTAADCGNLEMAASFLERLQHAANGLTFYRVPPLTSIAWRQLKSGDRAAAAKTLDDSLSAAADLPIEGVFSIDAASWLAAALTVAGRDKEARALVQKFPSTGPAGRLAAAEARAAAWNTYDVDRADQERPVLDAPSLQLPVVVEIAVAMGFPAEALRLAQSISEESLRTECEVAWLEAVQRAKSPKGGPAPDAVLAKLKPAAQARCHARFALLRLRANDRAGAEAELKASLAALGSAQAGAEFVLPSLKEIYQWQPSDPGPARQNALAFAEIARLQAGLGHAEDAQRNLATSLECLRATAPSPSAVDAKDKAEKKNRAGLRAELRTSLKLSETQAEAAANQYGRHLKALGEAANARFALELEVLDISLAWANPSEMWTLIGKRATAGDLDRREPFWRSPLPWQLMVRMKSKGENPETGAFGAIRKIVGETPPNPVGLLDALIAESNAADPADLVKDLKSIEDVDRSDQERTGFIVADRLVSNGQFLKAFQFARLLEDPVLKEETMQWSVALACRLGQARPVKNILHESNSSFLPTELVAAWRGFLVGLLARERAEPAAASAAPPPSHSPAGDGSKRAESTKG